MDAVNSIFELTSLDEIANCTDLALMNRVLQPAEVRHILQVGKAYWVYEGEPDEGRPHALLHSGMHSNGFVNVGGVIKGNAKIRALLAHSLALTIARYSNGNTVSNFTHVVGADTSSTLLAGDVATFFGVNHILMVKTETGSGKSVQNWSLKNSIFPNELAGSYVMQVEELITTSASAREVRFGMLKATIRQTNFCKILPTIVDRSDPDDPVEVIDGSRVLSLLRVPLKNFDQGTCPYCAAGSKAIKPKEGDNWKFLNG